MEGSRSESFPCNVSSLSSTGCGYGMPLFFVFGLVLSWTLVSCHENPSLTEAEAVVERYEGARNQFDHLAVAEELHSEMLTFYKRCLIGVIANSHIYVHGKELRDRFGVKNAEEVEAMDPKAATLLLLQWMNGAPAPKREKYPKEEPFRIHIVGVVADGNDVSVLFRYPDDVGEHAEPNAPRVILLRKEHGQLKVISSTMIEVEKAKAFEYWDVRD